MRSAALLLGVALFLCGLCAPRGAQAADPVNASFRGIAVEGTDVVAYFTDGKAVEGSKEHVATWNGATWRFASDEHKKLFEADPESYAPQFGGYCAYAVSQGKTAGIDPEAWKIVDGKLYLNYSPKIQERWEEDIPGFIEKGEANWPKIVDD